jgi:hypothetical protein
MMCSLAWRSRLAGQRMRELLFNQFSTATLTWGESLRKKFNPEACSNMEVVSVIDLAQFQEKQPT